MLGFVVTAEDDRCAVPARLRGDHPPQPRAAQGTEPAAACCSPSGCGHPSDLDRAEEWYSERGCRVERRPAGAVRGIGEAVRVEDPLGFTVEFFHAIDRTERLLQRYDLHHGAAIARIDHFNISVNDVPTAYDYYESLGFRCSETIEDEHRCTRRGCTASRASTTSP